MFREVVEPGPKAWKTAERIRDRLRVEVAERRNPRTSSTVDQLLERYLSEFDGAPNVLTLYRGYARNHILPYSGRFRSGTVSAERPAPVG